MKRIILYKPVSNVQIGHLYEHILCNQLTNALRSEGIFEYVDYDLDAKTFYKGFVRLDVATYTSHSQRVIELLNSLPATFSNDEISAGLLQILAEKQADVRVYNDNAVKKNLRQIHEQPWLNLSDMNSVANYAKLTTRHMNFADRPARYFGRLTQRISISQEFFDRNADLLPLYVVVAKALRINLQSAVAGSSYCYSTEDMFKVGSRIEDINVYRLDKRQARGLSDEIETTELLLAAMAQHEFVGRLSHYLINATLDGQDQFPNDEEIIKKTGVIVGLEYWKKYGTEANVRLLLDEMMITYTLGKDTRSLVVADLRLF